MTFPTEWKVIKFHGSTPPTSHLDGNTYIYIYYPIRITISHYLPSVGYLQWLPSTKMIMDRETQWGEPRTWFTFMLGFQSMYIVVDRAFSWSFKVSLDLFICEWWHCDFASVCQPPSPPSPPAPFRILFATLRMRASITFQRKFILATSDFCSSLNNTVSPWDCTDFHNLGWNDNFLELKRVESNIETDLAWILIFTSRCPSANGLLKSKWFEIHKKATMKQPWNYRNSHPNVDLICLNWLPPPQKNKWFPIWWIYR